MKIQIVSDLHLEFSLCTVPNTDADVLVLSGDILKAYNLHRLHDWLDANNNADVAICKVGSAVHLGYQFRSFLKQCSQNYRHVVYVAGNHEFYNNCFYDALFHLRQEMANYPNIHFLENEFVEIDGVVFLGATLWTDCHKADPQVVNGLGSKLNDFFLIRNGKEKYRPLHPKDIVWRHRETLDYFNHTLIQLGRPKTVVVGHHAPSYKSIAEKYQHDYITNGGFASDLEKFILDHPEIVLWTHGHTHTPFDYMIGSTRTVCNPRGYESEGEYTGWNPKLTVEI